MLSGVIVMDKTDNGENHSETSLKVTDDKKRRWNSFRKGKKQIKKLWKSKRTSKQEDEDQSSHSDEDSHENVAYDNANDNFSVSSPISPISTTSSVDRIPSIMLHGPASLTNSSPEYMAGTTDEDELFATGKENENPKSRSLTRGGELTRQQGINVSH